MSIFQQRRLKLADILEDGDAIFIFSGRSVACSEDECYPFSVNRSFYYLTGLDEEDMTLVLRKTNDKVVTTMFISEVVGIEAKFIGASMSKSDVKRVTGVDQIYDKEDIMDFVGSLYNYNQASGHMRIWLDLWRYRYDQVQSEAEKFARKLESTYVNVEIKDIRDRLAQMRMIKDETEVKEIIKAIDITKLGIESMMRSIKPGMNEMVIEAIFNLTIAHKGCKKTAFTTIAASGPRATTLHYSDNNQVANDGELFLVDLGATSGLYCADISRTFPVNGKFSSRQRAIYNTVLAAQRIVEANAKPGITIRELNELVIAHYKRELPKLDLDKDVSEYYYHGIGHHLGLDTHDITSSNKKKLEPGMIITNEPGLYIADEGIGIRIEDDLLITKDGCINLAKDIPHEADEIEGLMQN